jgi:transposase
LEKICDGKKDNRNGSKKQIGIFQTFGHGTMTISLLSFLPYCCTELPRRGVTRKILWGDYRTRYPDGYSYSKFCEYLMQYLEQSLHIKQQRGDKLHIDFAESRI